MQDTYLHTFYFYFTLVDYIALYVILYLHYITFF